MKKKIDNEERAVRRIVGKLNRIAKFETEAIMRRAVNRWQGAKRAQASLERRRLVLEKELAVVSRKLR